ncbi:MAG TPA: class I SAM-dependent methyltransferase [Polyangiaceae bacterium]|nr:class I SAM-dependent methyltransferase [Polyangiaceae bacterium]
MTTSCNVCGADCSLPLLELHGVPALCNQPCATASEARAVRRADVDLRYCRCCGHMFNASFDPAVAEYSARYENSLGFSERFRTYARECVDELDSMHELAGKTVVEVGSGRGEFLAELASRGIATGIGIDPGAQEPELPSRDACRIDLLRELFGPRHTTLRADLVCSRQCLEHLGSPVQSLRNMRSIVAPRGGAVFVEVPNGTYMLREVAVWDVLYEHVSYFTHLSLANAVSLAAMGASVQEVFSGQFLVAHAKATTRPAPLSAPSEQLDSLAMSFARSAAQKVEQVRNALRGLRREGQRAVLWGAGTKGVMLLNTLGEDAAVVAAVDVNPRKHGSFVAGTGHPIISPAAVPDLRPDCVIVVNPVYRAEIEAALAGFGVQARVLSA